MKVPAAHPRRQHQPWADGAPTTELYHQFNQNRKQREAMQANLQDEADLQALDNTLNKRPRP